MSLGHFASVCLPYGMIQRGENGLWEVYNREYAALGSLDYYCTPDQDVLRSHLELEGFTKQKMIAAHSPSECNVDNSPFHTAKDGTPVCCVHFYHDGNAPWHEKKHMEAYLKRLAIVAGCEVMNGRRT